MRVLQSTGQVFCGISLNLGSSDVFLVIRRESWASRKISQKRSALPNTAQRDVHIVKMTCHWPCWLRSLGQHDFTSLLLKVALFNFPCPYSVLWKHEIKSRPCSREEVIKLQILTSDNFEPVNPPITEAKYPQSFSFPWVNMFFYCWNQFGLNFCHLQVKDLTDAPYSFLLISIHPPHKSQHDLWIYDKFSERPLGHSLFVQPAWWTSLGLLNWCSPEASTPSASLG